MSEIIIDKNAKQITFTNNGIGFSQFGIADEVLDLIENQIKEIERLKSRLEEYQEYVEINHKEIERLKDVIKNKHLKEIERLNNIINEFEEELKWQRKVCLSLNEGFTISRIDTLINKLQELKGVDNNE